MGAQQTQRRAGISLHPVLPPRPPTSSSTVGKLQIKQLERRLTWPLWLTRKSEVKLVFQCYLDGMAASCRRQAVVDRRLLCSCLFSAFQVASKDHPWEVLHRFERKACWPMCVNGASRQPSRQNRCSEVADGAGIARKWQATALMTAQYTGVGVAWVVSTWRVINLITDDTFWKPATSLKPAYRLPY